MKCTNCDIEIAPEMKFCFSCGKKMFVAPRSRNELKAECEKISAVLRNAKKFPVEIRVTLLVIITQAFQWAMGETDVALSSTLADAESCAPMGDQAPSTENEKK